MARLVLLIMFPLVAIVPSWATAQDYTTWAGRVDTGKEVVTTLQFYFHDVLSRRNPSAVRIAQASQTNSSLTLFGLVMMVDDLLSIGQDPNSKMLGRARGIYGSAGQDDTGLIMVMSYGFVDGIYNGSSFSLLSINPALNPVREMSIVGGTGLFRLARGYAIAQTYSFDPTTGDAVESFGDFDGQDVFIAPEFTNGIGEGERKTIDLMEKLSGDGFEKLILENDLDAVVTLGSTAATVLAIGGYPGITVPGGYDRDGMPFGILFAGLKGMEPKLIEIAFAFEQATMIRRRPPISRSVEFNSKYSL